MNMGAAAKLAIEVCPVRKRWTIIPRQRRRQAMEKMPPLFWLARAINRIWRHRAVFDL
jgi:hypothetical protein